jgi:hypothetical protein
MYVLLEKQKYFACGLKIPDQVGNDSWGGQVRTSTKVEYRRKPDPTSMDTGFRRYGFLAMGKLRWGYRLLPACQKIHKGL